MSSLSSSCGGFDTLGIAAQWPVQESMCAHDVDQNGHWLVVILSILLRMVSINENPVTSSNGIPFRLHLASAGGQECGTDRKRPFGSRN